ncbi:HCL570Wp [Eremothecium sinecaudum]|uniref:Restriction of telomere capping protein 4 n=1 Tax=Eremothecium sinecaudum TaxID=45286 RepID=A0A109UVZ9_9SACH|nr:HCL570Wp [Eremothecium sinecaudum]AMD19581.1 HCL570Wp [Eremothecium sinecaudum]
MCCTVMSTPSLQKKRNKSIYKTQDDGENSSFFKRHHYTRRLSENTGELSDNEYTSGNSSSSDRQSGRSLDLEGGELLLNKNLERAVSDVDKDSSILSSSSLSISGSSDSDNDSQPVAAGTDTPILFTVPKENMKTIEVTGRLKDIHDEVIQREHTPLEQNTSKMVFKDQFDTVAQYNHIKDVRLRFKKEFNVPRTLFADQLLEKARKYLPLIDQILQGTRASMYYDNARIAFKNSNKAMLSVQEFRTLELRSFTAGYFGVKRQIRLSSEILETYRDELSKHKNPTVQWWGPTDFSHYVLAPEVLSYVCKEEMSFADIEDAWSYMEKTAEYGLVVADEEPMELWEITYEKEKLERLGLGPEYSSLSYRDVPSEKRSNAEPKSSRQLRKRQKLSK